MLTPLLNVGVYYLVFGVIFGARRGIPNYTAFLVAGVFVFSFTERSILVGAKGMADNLALIRAMYCPRTCLPLARLPSRRSRRSRRSWASGVGGTGRAGRLATPVKEVLLI